MQGSIPRARRASRKSREAASTLQLQRYLRSFSCTFFVCTSLSDKISTIRLQLKKKKEKKKKRKQNGDTAEDPGGFCYAYAPTLLSLEHEGRKAMFVHLRELSQYHAELNQCE